MYTAAGRCNLKDDCAVHKEEEDDPGSGFWRTVGEGDERNFVYVESLGYPWDIYWRGSQAKGFLCPWPRKAVKM